MRRATSIEYLVSVITYIFMKGRGKCDVKKEGSGTMEAEITVMWPQAKKY